MDFSFVICEYRCLEEIGPCLEALRAHAEGLSHEFIISSNSEHSRDEREQLKRDHPNARWLFNGKNGGYAYAANRGIELAFGDFVVILNADVRLRCGLGPALRFLNAHDEAAVLGPRIVDDMGELQDSARPFMTPWRAIRRSMARMVKGEKVLLEEKFDYGRAQTVNWVIGAFMIVRRSMIDQAGMLDEGYFMYVEDMDWCRRFWDRGLQVWYFPELIVEFAGTRRSSSFLSGTGGPGRHSLMHAKSYLRFVMKHGISFQARHPGRM